MRSVRCWLRLRVAQFRNLGQGGELNLVKKYFVHIDQWGKAVQLIIFCSKNLEFGGSVSGFIQGS